MTAANPARPDLLLIDQHIARALAAVRRARAASGGSLTAEDLRAEELAQWQLDLFLDRRFVVQGARPSPATPLAR